MASVSLMKSILKVITEWFNGFNVTVEPMEEKLFTHHQVNGRGATIWEKALVSYICFMKGKKGQQNYISIAMKKYFLVKEAKKDCKRVLSSLPLHEETIPMSLLEKESVAEANSCLQVSILPFFLNNRLYSIKSVNRIYFPVSCVAHGVAMWPSSDQRNVNWSGAQGSVRRLTKGNWLHWEIKLRPPP